MGTVFLLFKEINQVMETAPVMGMTLMMEMTTTEEYVEFVGWDAISLFMECKSTNFSTYTVDFFFM